MIRGTGHTQSAGAFAPVEVPGRRQYPGHAKLMQDLKGARLKIEVGRPDTETTQRVHQESAESEGSRATGSM